MENKIEGDVKSQHPPPPVVENTFLQAGPVEYAQTKG